MELTPAGSIDLLQNLVGIYSPSGQEGKASAWLAEWMAAQGFHAWVDAAGNAVGTRGDGPRRILLLGHIDTFPGELEVYREGDWLYGRGAVDAKGPLAAFAAAAAALEVPPGWQVAVVGAVEEEAATSRGARYLLKHWPVPDMCIIGEPSGWERVTLGYKGRLLAEVHLRAAWAHSAGLARPPAEQAVALWSQIVAFCDDYNAGRDKAFERLDPSLRHIATRDEGAYGSVHMSLGFRLPPDVAPSALADDLGRLLGGSPQPQPPRPERRSRGGLRAAWPAPGQPSVHLTFSGAEVAFRAEKNTQLVRTCLASIRGQGGQARFVVKTGTSDMNVVGPAWGCPICAYGPGDSALDHTPDERISLSEYWRSIEILKSALTALTGSTDGVTYDTR